MKGAKYYHHAINDRPPTADLARTAKIRS